jgi:hypothetical protein
MTAKGWMGNSWYAYNFIAKGTTSAGTLLNELGVQAARMERNASCPARDGCFVLRFRSPTTIFPRSCQSRFARVLKQP